MKKQIDNNMPIGKITIIDDFLPPPEVMVKYQKNQKITIILNEFSLDFFKNLAKKKGIKYQPLIRRVLEKYAEKHAEIMSKD